jgi:NTE family protein
MNVQVQPHLTVAKRALPFECVALVLQGGGALGAYQAGVYEALAEANIDPDWVAGVSIGAINSAIIAGNEPAERVAKLRTFWQEITANPLLDWVAAVDALTPKGDLPRALFNQLPGRSRLLSDRRLQGSVR